MREKGERGRRSSWVRLSIGIGWLEEGKVEPGWLPRVDNIFF